jgi:hypothetical protein
MELKTIVQLPIEEEQGSVSLLLSVEDGVLTFQLKNLEGEQWFEFTVFSNDFLVALAKLDVVSTTNTDVS